MKRVVSWLKGLLERSDQTQSLWRELVAAVKSGDSAKIRGILRACPGLAQLKDDSGRSLLHMTDQQGVAETLIVNGVLVDTQDNNGLTPLHHAAKSGNEAMAQQLIVGGADTTIKTFKRITAAEMARENGHDNIVKFLMGDDDDTPVLPHTPAQTRHNTVNHA